MYYLKNTKDSGGRTQETKRDMLQCRKCQELNHAQNFCSKPKNTNRINLSLEYTSAELYIKA